MIRSLLERWRASFDKSQLNVKLDRAPKKPGKVKADKANKGAEVSKIDKKRKAARMELADIKAQSQSDAIRLNLGCGDKKLPGYINIDYAASRKGVVPDIIADLRSLSFKDGLVDEILSVHVIEHFYYWEARELLIEWSRVLKCGGKLVLECPNILTAARALLDDPEKASGIGKESSMSMWALYGDPNWKDPLMCHKWGYTPASLQRLLLEVGFEHVRQEPAQFKKREPRDMRVVGIWAGEKARHAAA